MIAETYLTVSTLSVEKTEADSLVAALFSQASGPLRRPIEYVALHQTLTEGTKIVDQQLYLADHNSDYFAIYCASEDEFSTFVSYLREQYKYKSLRTHGSHRLSRVALPHPKQAKEDTGLVKNHVTIELAIAPATQGEGWTFSFAREIWLEAIPSLQYAMTVCCALGTDGCSPLADVAMKVISFDPRCADAFAYRQRAAIYRAVRRCFLKALA